MHIRMRVARILHLLHHIQFIFKLNIWILGLWLAALVLSVGAMHSAAISNESVTLLESRTCSVDIDATLENLHSEKITLYIQCGEKQYTTKDTKNIAIAYQNPQSLQCDIVQGNSTKQHKILCKDTRVSSTDNVTTN